MTLGWRHRDMHDIRWIRENPAEFDRGLARRGLPSCAAEILARDQKWREAQTLSQNLQAERDKISPGSGAAKKRGEAGDGFLLAIASRRRCATAARRRPPEH